MFNKSLKKRITAAAMAVVTVIGMYQGSISSLAFTYEGGTSGDAPVECGSGGGISTTFTIDSQSAYQEITRISFDAYIPDAGTLVYNWEIKPDGESASSGGGTETNTNPAPADGVDPDYNQTHIDIDVSGITVATGQTVDVTIRFPSGALVCNGGKIWMETNSGSEPSDVGSISLTVNGSSNGIYYVSKDQIDASALTIVASPDKAHRTVIGSGASLNSNGDNTFTVQAIDIGKHTYTFSSGGRSASVDIYVYDASFDSAVYGGGNPLVHVYDGSADNSTTELGSSYFDVTYDTDASAGTHTATIAINGTSLTFNKSYTISQKTIAASDFAGATWAVNSSTGVATSDKLTSSDYDATAVLYRSGLGKNYYNITVRGKGNYTGTVPLNNIEVMASPDGSLIDINDVFAAELDASYIYDGTAKEPKPTIKDNEGTVLSGMFDSSGYLNIDWDNNIGASDEAKCIVSGRRDKGYTGSMELYFTIEPKDITSDADINITLDLPTQASEYYAINTGNRIEPVPTVTLSGRPLTNGKDYNVSYSNNINISKNAVVTIEGIGNYTGSRDVKFEIVANVEQDVYVKIGTTQKVKVVNGKAATSYSASYNYGAEVKPIVKVYSGNTEISPLSITYTDATKAGTATAEIKFDGKYAGGSGTKTISATYTITPVSIQLSNIALDNPTNVFSGKPVSVTGTVSKGIHTLTADDYDITYSVPNPTDAGVYTATFTGKGNYTGSNTADFSIMPISLADAKVEVSDLAASYAYTGRDITPAVTLKVDGTTVTTGYKVEYANNRNCGTAKVTIKPEPTQNNNFIGQITKTFTITKKSMGDLKYILNGNVLSVSGNKATSNYTTAYDRTNKTVSGLVIQDPITGDTLRSGVDYNITYSNNVNAGTAEMKISASASGNYSDSAPVIVTFTIKPRDINNSMINTSKYTVGATPDVQGYILPTFTIKDTGNASLKINALQIGTDYTVSAKTNCRTAGSSVCTITGKGNYTGTRDVSYEIGASIDKAVVVLINPYDGTTEIGRYPVPIVNDEINMPYIGEREPIVKIDYDGLLKDLDGVDGLGITKSEHTSTWAGSSGNKWNSYGNRNTVSFTLDASSSPAFYGTRTLTYRIQKVSLTGATVVDNDPTTAVGKDFEYNFTGSPIAIKPTENPSDTGAGKMYIMVNGMVVKPADYSLSTSAIGPDAGTYSVVFRGTEDATSNFKDSVTQSYEIVKGNFTMSIKGGTSFSFTGTQIKPEVEVKDTVNGGRLLTEGVDYTLTYGTNNEIGTGKGTITATGMGNYYGASDTKTFNITQIDLSTAAITVTADPIAYTGPGMSKTLEDIHFTVKLNGKTLTRGAGAGYDYDASIGTISAAQVGLAKDNRGVAVVITGNGVTYTGTRTVYVDLTADLATFFNASINGETNPIDVDIWKALTASDITVSHKVDSADQLPNNEGLYTITKSGVVPGVQSITVSGVRSKGTSGSVIISSKNIQGDLASSNVTVTLDKSTYDYTGASITPIISVKYDGVLVPSTNYETVITDNTDVGTGKVTIKGRAGSSFWNGNTTQKTFDIVYNFNNAVVALDRDTYTFDGSPKTPIPTVTINGHTISGTFYDVNYVNNENVGTATVTVSAASGQPARGLKSKTFKITAISDGVDAVFTSTGNGSVQEVYTGDPIKPAITVKSGATSLIENSDYTVAYTNNTNVTSSDSKARAVITLKGNYSGIIPLEFEILQKSFESAADIVVGVDPAYFTGNTNAPRPAYTVSYNGRTLRENIDYRFVSVSYAGDQKFGDNQGLLTVEGLNNFKLTKTVPYDIRSLDIGADNSGVVIDSTSEYDGTNHYDNVKSHVKLYYNNEELSSDYYTVSVAGAVLGNNMTDAGTYSISITGVGGFTGSRLTAYTIEPAKLVDSDGNLVSSRFKVELTPDAYDYNNGSPVVPADANLVVTDMKCDNASKIMDKGTEYTVRYIDNQTSAAGTADSGPRVEITGTGNYQGVYIKPFKIGKEIKTANIASVLAPPEASFIYDGKTHVPSITRLTYDPAGVNRELILGVDYKIKSLPEDQINAGIKKIIVEGIGEFYGEAEVEYLIQPKTTVPSQIRIELPDTSRDGSGYYAVYTGENIEPRVVVYDDAISRTKPIDSKFYSVAYTNNKNVSTAQNAIVQVTLNTYPSPNANYAVGGDVDPVYFEIRGRQMGGMSLTIDQPTIAYNSADPICAPNETVVYDDGISASPITLTRGVDYSVSYEYYGYDPDDPTNCKNPNNEPVAGPVKLTVTGNGNYTGTKSIQYIIYGDLSELPSSIPNQMYTGEQIIPDVTELVCGGRKLEASDVRLTSTSPDGFTEHGTLYIDANNSYYTNRKQINFNIVFDASSINVATPDGVDYVYSGRPIEPNFVVTTSDGAAVPDSALTITYKNDATGTADHTNVGDITATIKLTVGIKEISVDKQFHIVPMDINSAKAFIVGTNYFDGSDIYPYMEIRRNTDSEKLVLNRDYTAVYHGDSNGNKKYPTESGDPAIIVVTGKGNYAGTRNLEYTIESPALTGLRVNTTTDTTADISWSRISSAHGYQVELPNGQVVSIPGNDKTTYTVTGLNPASISNVKVRTYVTIGGTTYCGTYSTLNVSTNMSKSVGTGASNSATTATVSWDADVSAAQGIIGYKIFRSTSKNGAYSLVAIVPRTRNAYTDGGLVSGTTYYYKIQGYKYDGTYVYSPESDPIAITVK